MTSSFSSRIFNRASARGGYALAVTMVFVAVGITIAAGLAVTRQMWGQMGEKQLHRVLTQTAMDVDSLAMLSVMRQNLNVTGSTDIYADPASAPTGYVNPFNPQRTVLTISPLAGEDQNPTVAYQSSTRIALPDGWEDGGFYPLATNVFYDEIDQTPALTGLGAWDPFQSIWSVSTGFGVLTENELAGGVRVDKSVKTMRDTEGKWKSGSRLHAWMEVDTAKIHEVAVRRLPASAFTLFVPSVAGNLESTALGDWAGGSSVSMPVGRYYMETQMVPGRNGIVLENPIVATKGFQWSNTAWSDGPNSWTLKVPIPIGAGENGSQSGFRTVSGAMDAPESTDFYKNRYLKFGGMFATGEDRPVKLIQFGGQMASLQGVSSGTDSWVPPDVVVPVAATAPNVLAQLWGRADIKVGRTGPNVGEAFWMEGGSPTPCLPLSTPGVVSVDDSRHLITLNLAGVDSIGRDSLVLFVEAGGNDGSGNPISNAERVQYRVRVVCPSVDELGWGSSAFSPTGVGGLTVASALPIILVNGFNSGASAESVILDNSSSSGVTVVGTWVGSSTHTGFYGSDYLHDDNTSKGSNSVTFAPNLSSAGSYKVYIRYSGDATHSVSVPVTVSHNGGSTKLSVNQTMNGGDWVLLGDYDFSPGSLGTVTVSNAGTAGYVVADAVKFEKVMVAGGTSVPAMVASQNLVVSGVEGAPASIQGVFLTTGQLESASGNPIAEVFQGETGLVPSSLSVYGSILLWERYAVRPVVPGFPALDSTLYPLSLYISGKSFPPGVPSLLDVRFAREQLRNYRIYSEDTTLTPGGS